MNKKYLFLTALIISFSYDINAAKYDKKDPSELYEEATNQLKKEDYKAAMKTLKKYTKAEKKDADGWTLLAFTNRKLKNYSKAETLYKKALKLDPKNKIALEYQGELYVELDRIDEAELNLSKLAELCPNSCKELEMLQNYIDGNSTKAW
tara:strand:- start:81 stop:530 length:450 start_codon:yes stop_codon:yes gene_type:complete